MRYRDAASWKANPDWWIRDNLSKYEKNVLGYEADPDYALVANRDRCHMYHRCDIRFFVTNDGGTLKSETAKVMLFQFYTYQEMYRAHENCAKRGVSCTRLPDKVLRVNLPYYPFKECECATSGFWPPRKRSLTVRFKKSMTKQERKRWRRKWRFASSDSKDLSEERKSGRRRRRRRKRK